ncbi:MAG: hypothetical protein ACP5IC_01090 [Minisyncoccia bacterium]
MLSARQKIILKEAIQEFVKSGEPVSSEKLYNSGKFSIRPAMLRWELNSLEKNGYLHQPHISSGRIPTNKAYRYLVNEILQKYENKQVNTNINIDNLNNLVDYLSNRLEIFTACYSFKREEFFQSGLVNLIKQFMDFTNNLLDIVEDIEFLPQKIKNNQEKFLYEDNWPQVFIGKNFLTKSDDLAVIAGKSFYQNIPIFIIGIGPKKMNYEKSVVIFKSLTNYDD